MIVVGPQNCGDNSGRGQTRARKQKYRGDAEHNNQPDGHARAGWVREWRRVGAGEKHDGSSRAHAAREAAAARRASDIAAATTGTAAQAAGLPELSRACWTDFAVAGSDRALMYTRARVAASAMERTLPAKSLLKLLSLFDETTWR